MTGELDLFSAAGIDPGSAIPATGPTCAVCSGPRGRRPICDRCRAAGHVALTLADSYARGGKPARRVIARGAGGDGARHLFAVRRVRVGMLGGVRMSSAVEVQRVARLPFQAEGDGSSPIPRLHFTTATVSEVNPLLATDHYLGPIATCRCAFAGWVDDELVAAMVYRWPTARMLPADGTWLELARWCLTEDAGKNAGSRMMGWAVKQIRHALPNVTTLVSYSDPSRGHTGALYRASGWSDDPTHHTLRFRANGRGYPSGHGSWDGLTVQAPKERWLMRLSLSSDVEAR